MGLAYSHLRRKTMRFNVENRAHRFIEREKPVPAPRYPTDRKFLNDLEKGYQSPLQTVKDDKLDKFLRDIYVKSTGPPPGVKRNTSKFPKNRHPVEDDDIGFVEPTDVPAGFCTLRQAMKFISDHQADPQLWSVQQISSHYNIDEKTIENILKYYSAFNIHVPAKNAQPIQVERNKLLPSNNKEEKT